MGFGIYANSLGGAFIWDDEYQVHRNTLIRDWSNSPRFFTGRLREGGGTEGSKFYRPIQTLSYAWDYRWWKENPRGYHLTNILLHLLVAWAVYALARTLTADHQLAFLSAVFFVVHPIHTEAVAYISGRADILAAFFSLTAFISYIRYLNGRRASSFLFFCLNNALALLSKESSLVFPALLLFYHGTRQKKAPLRGFYISLLITGAYLAVRFAALGPVLPNGFVDSWTERIPGTFAAFTAYLRLLFAPFNLHMEYGMSRFEALDPRVFCGAGIFAAACWSAFIWRKKYPLVFFCAGWFFLWLIPVLGLFRLNAWMAEHWLYLPSVGFFILLAKIFTEGCRNRKWRVATILCAAALMAWWAALTVRQNGTWRDPVSFFKRTIRFSGSGRLFYKLGMAYEKEGRFEEAAVNYRKAIETWPGLMESYSALGVLYKNAGRFEDAVQVFEKALRVAPHAGILNNLANTYHQMGETGKAIECYRRAVAIDGRNADCHFNLANEYLKAGRTREAVPEYLAALEISPEDREIQRNLAFARKKALAEK